MTERPGERTATRVGRQRKGSGAATPERGRVATSPTSSTAASTTPARTAGPSSPPAAATVVHSPTGPAAAPRKQPARPARRPPRRARLRLTRIDPWSVMKTAFLLSIAVGVTTVVAVLVVWSVLGAAGVWDSVNMTVQGLIGEESAGFDVENYVGMSRVLGFTMLVSVVDVVLITALATLAAFLYNLAAALLGGVEITLVEDN